jgi:hypothetical protein
MENHNKSDFKSSILEGGCVVGKGGQCLYQDKASLLKGNMSLAAKKKLTSMQLLKAKLTAKAKALKAAKVKAAKAKAVKLAKEKAAAKVH